MQEVQFSHSVTSNSLRSHGLQNARPPCPSPTPRAHSNSCPLSWWCHPTISSSVDPFSSCLQFFPASGSFPMSQFFTSGGQSIGVSASASVIPMNIQDWFPLGWTGLIFLQSKGLSRVFSTPQFKSINSSVLSFLYGPTLTSIHDYWNAGNPTSIPWLRRFLWRREWQPTPVEETVGLQAMELQWVGHNWATSTFTFIPDLLNQKLREEARNLCFINPSWDSSLVAQKVKRLPTMWETRIQSLGREDLLEKEMATHSSTLAWKIPWTEEPSGLQSMGSQRVRHDWATSLYFYKNVGTKSPKSYWFLFFQDILLPILFTLFMYLYLNTFYLSYLLTICSGVYSPSLGCQFLYTRLWT